MRPRKETSSAQAGTYAASLKNIDENFRFCRFFIHHA
jgi:hypothetical protein